MKQRSLLFLLISVSLGMFAFTFALVPLYSVFCKITGINGKIDLIAPRTGRYATQAALKGHVVTIELDANVHPSMPFDFFPEQAVLQVTPGTLHHTTYFIKNKTNQTWVVQAIPSISPGTVAKYLKKLDCFCFAKQHIKPNQSLRLPLRFWLEPEFPDSVHRFTLSYTLFDITKKESPNGS